MIERNEDGITVTLGRVSLHASNNRSYYTPNRDFFMWLGNRLYRKLWVGGLYIQIDRK